MADQEKYKVLFLCTRLADYMWSSLGHLVDHYPVEVDIVRYPPDRLAPFQFELSPGRQLYDYSEVKNVGFKRFIENVNPDIVYVAGWSDKTYNKAVKSLKKKIPIILGLDNPWKNTSRQKAGVILAGSSLRQIFTHVWVAGMPQYAFARRLGFRDYKILRGLYVANGERFRTAYVRKVNDLSGMKTLIFVGRYVEYKRPHWLVKAFSELVEEGVASEWRLHMYGDGPLGKDLKTASADIEQIQIHSFQKPDEIAQIMMKAHGFCLPSFNEHWGVVIHEAATAGLPLVLSDSCGAAGAFLIHGYNGFQFETNEYESLRSSLRKLLVCSNERLSTMSERSMVLSQSISQEKWSANLMSVL